MPADPLTGINPTWRCEEEHGGSWEPEITGNQQLEKIVHIPWYSVIVDHSPMSVPSVFDHVDTQNWGCNQQRRNSSTNMVIFRTKIGHELGFSKPKNGGEPSLRGS
jgi:hypothetical protein